MNRRFFVLLLFVAVAAAFTGVAAGWSPASAAPGAAGTFIVDRLDDSADPAAQGCAAAASDCTLRGAIIKANANPGSNILIFAGSGHTLTVAKTGTDDATSGDLNVTAPMTIATACLFPPCNPTVVQGGAGWDDRIFRVSAAGVRISGLTIRGGNAADGGGILIATGGALTVTSGFVAGNAASDNGGGIYLESGARLSLQNSAVTSNTAVFGAGVSGIVFGRMEFDGVTVTANVAYTSGGGIFAGVGQLDIRDSLLARNSAGSDGGAINTGNYVIFSVDASRVLSNSAARGAGIFHGLYSTATLTNTVVQANQASSDGGGIFNSGSLHMRDLTVNYNSAPRGGGLYGLGPMTITSSAIFSNAATELGGGIIASNNLFMPNSTVSQNRSDLHGGGMYIAGSAYTMTIQNATIAHNVADADGNGTGVGGGIYQVFGYVTLLNSIVARNVTGGAGLNHPDCHGSATSRGYNLIGSSAGCTLSGDATGNLLGLDPVLGNLRDNGGPTWTHALLPGSPAIDTAHPGICPIRDQRGVIRPVNGTGQALAWCDIGAYEYNGPTVKRMLLPVIRR